jgi:hypothetical protein
MAGRGMGAATRGGGAVESGPKNKVISETSQTTGPVMMAKGGDAKKKPKGMAAGGMMSKGYAAGGPAKKMSKGMAAGGKR